MSTPTSPSGYADLLTGRDRAVLVAVADGRATISCRCEPDLFIDGVCYCDQAEAHTLARWGLIAPHAPAPSGSCVPAVLTRAGRAALDGAQP